jgi:hypothetical protein
VVVIAFEFLAGGFAPVNIEEKQKPGKCGAGRNCLGNFELGGKAERSRSTFGRGAER